jgi:hypothetical protein
MNLSFLFNNPAKIFLGWGQLVAIIIGHNTPIYITSPILDPIIAKNISYCANVVSKTQTSDKCTMNTLEIAIILNHVKYFSAFFAYSTVYLILIHMFLIYSAPIGKKKIKE